MTLALALVGIARADAAPVAIHSGAEWLDTAGNRINSHGGCILQVGDAFYWFGESRRGRGPSQEINCYRSTDLAHWEFRGEAFSKSTAGPDLQDINLERPKVIYNKLTGRYVLFAHRENASDYTLARILIASSETVDGTYSYVADFRPMGNDSRDMTVFQDDDGTAYLISSTRTNADLAAYKLAPDYLSVESQAATLFPGGHREAPAVFKRTVDGEPYYYIITSGSTYWAANANLVSWSKSLTGPFGPQQLLCNKDTWNTYCSQSAFVLPVRGEGGATYVFMADRWKAHDIEDSRYQWLPIPFKDEHTVAPQPVEFGDAWRIDAATGRCAYPLALEPSPGNLAKGAVCLASTKNKPDGNEASMAFDGDAKTRWCADDGDYPHWLKVDLGSTVRMSGSEITWERHRDVAYQYKIEGSSDGEAWTTLVDKSKNEDVAPVQADKFDAEARFVRLTATNAKCPPGGYAWASVCEWKLLADDTAITLNMHAEADSEQSGSYSTKAADGDFSTAWRSGNGNADNWWQVDLGGAHDVTGCRFMWESPGFLYQFKIEVSSDGEQWSTVVDRSSNAEIEWAPVHAFSAHDVRYVRLSSTKLETGCWMGLMEFEAFDSTPLPRGQQYAEH